MYSTRPQVDTGMSVSFIFSAVIHLAVFLLLIWYAEQFPPQVAVQETYYVDVVNLPVAEPKPGSAEQSPADSGKTPLDATPTPQMSLPVPLPKTSVKVPAKKTKPHLPQNNQESDAAFTERLAKLEKMNESRHEEAVLERLRKKVKAGSNAKTGASAAMGSKTGSRYADYIKSRLEDALKTTSNYTTKNPEVTVHLTISAEGKLLRTQIERSSGDAAFELAVRRAIDLASEKFTVPPNHAVFENGFIFRPKSITDGTLR